LGKTFGNGSNEGTMSEKKRGAIKKEEEVEFA